MGLFKDEDPPLASNYHRRHTPKWRLDQISPYGANIVFVLYQCNSQFYIQAILNEKTVYIPGCEDILCSLNTIVSMWLPYAMNCDIPSICQDDSLSKNQLQYWIDHLFLL